MITQPPKANYQHYLASREWALKREAVRARSGGRCEHCYVGYQQAVHHLTYERLGSERLTDLMAICRDCHGYLSGKPGKNPLLDWWITSPRLLVPGMSEALGKDVFGHFIVPTAVPEKTLSLPVRHVFCEEPCLWCEYSDPDWVLYLPYLFMNWDGMPEWRKPSGIR